MNRLDAHGYNQDEMQRALAESQFEADIRKAQEASLKEKQIQDDAKLARRLAASPDHQLAAARSRFATNHATGRSANHHPSRVTSCNCTSLFKRAVKVTLVTAAVGLAAYACYNNMGAIQSVLGNFSGQNIAQLTARLTTNATQLANLMGLSSLATSAKELLISVSARVNIKIAGFIGLLLIKAHKAVANFIQNHIKLILAVAILGAAIAYNPTVSPALQKASEFLAKSIISDFLSANAKYIGVILTNLAILGFVHKAYDYYCQNHRFTGPAHRL